MNARAVFLDCDGTLMEDVGYCHRAGDVQVFPGVAEALFLLRNAGFGLVIITNQSGIGRGYFREDDYQAVQAELLRQLGPGLIDATYFCPAAPDDASERRKPAPGMLLEAQRDYGIDLTRSYFIGDHASDIECARRAGLAGAVLVQTGRDQNGFADYCALDFSSAANWILNAALLAVPT